MSFKIFFRPTIRKFEFGKTKQIFFEIELIWETTQNFEEANDTKIYRSPLQMDLNNQNKLLYGNEMYLERIKLPTQHVVEEMEMEDEEVEESDDDNNGNGPTKKTEKAKWSTEEVIWLSFCFWLLDDEVFLKLGRNFATSGFDK